MSLAQIYAPAYAPGAYMVYKPYARVSRTLHSVLRKHLRLFATIRGRSSGGISGRWGFSASNLWRMKGFYEVYASSEKLAPLVREIAWSHNLVHPRTMRPNPSAWPPTASSSAYPKNSRDSCRVPRRSPSFWRLGIE